MKTRCRNCRTYIDFRTTYCDKCKSEKTKDSKSARNEIIEKTTKSGKWKRIRNEVLLRDKCCIPCLLNDVIEYRKLQVHHIYKRIEREDLIYDKSNLVTVCPQCHEKLELLTPKEQLNLLGDFYVEEEYELL